MASHCQETTELSPQDYLAKVKDAYAGEFKNKLVTKFITNDDPSSVTIEDTKSPTTLYWKSCSDRDYKLVKNVEAVKILIEDCQNCTIDLQGKVLTNVVEIWKCENLTLKVLPLSIICFFKI